MPRPTDAASFAKTAILDAPGAAAFPTWTWWGRTTVQIYNTGNTPVTVSVQAGAAAASVINLDQGENWREYGYWAGFPVTITNTGQQDTVNNQFPQIEVWVW